MDDPDTPTDERPIVKIYPMDDAASYEVVAPSLRDFLSLVAVAFAEVVTRNATDNQWARFRSEWYGDRPDLIREMGDLAQRLLGIPGVRLPESPSALARAAPNRNFVGA